MTVDDGPGLRARLLRDDLAPTFTRWRVTLPPGSAMPTRAHSWNGVLVLVEQGSLEVECIAGGRQTFKRGDLLALGWLPLRTLHNPGPSPTMLLAMRRAGHDSMSNSHRSWHVLQVTGAKTEETRQRRIGKSVAILREGRARCR